jgi:hypothetical protein
MVPRNRARSETLECWGHGLQDRSVAAGIRDLGDCEKSIRSLEVEVEDEKEDQGAVNVVLESRGCDDIVP